MKMSVRDVDVKGKRVLVRVDFNVPLDKKTGEIADDRRIRAAVPTIQYITDNGGKAMLVSHLGRPKGITEGLRMDKMAQRLGAIMGKPVAKVNDCVGLDVAAAVAKMRDGDVLMLENVRFHDEEEKNDEAFAKKLAENADVYVNDAFGTAHRAHASTAGVARFLPSYCGFLIQKEIDIMGKALASPDRPFVVILGGAKVSDKIGVIENLLGKADALLIGGGMAFTFLKAQGREIGKSLLEADKIEYAKSLLEKAKGKIILPADVIVADKIDTAAQYGTVPADNMPADMIGVDIGPETVKLFASKLTGARTVIWNGPMGVFEIKQFAKGTEEIAKILGGLKATTIVGGGDSAAAVEKLGYADKITHISTGGGASLEFLEGIELPGIKVLQDV